ncbi:MAG: aminopeptidase P family protein [Lactobacillaceae bacterium]|jgi:Xaa-Pro aminopeptidase|nr:aminopeptidase P family protein [Lactobacillaceae bacterium]
MNLDSLQKQIKENGLDALYVNLNNMFIGQDILDEENNILKLTGFSGSAAELIVTPDKAYLFTDGRYELQAKRQTDNEKVEIFINSRDLYDFIENYKGGKDIKIGFNPWTVSFDKFEKLQFLTDKRKDGKLAFVPSGLIKHNTSVKKPKVFELDIKYAGESREKKIKDLLKHIKNAQIDAYLFTAADSVSWLLNLRSDYNPSSPVLRAFALVDKNLNLTVFSDDFARLNSLTAVNIAEIENEIAKYHGQKISFDKNSPVVLLSIMEKNNIEACHFFDVCNEKKAIKNKAETACMKNAHLKDGAAVTKLLYWLENNWKEKTELDIAAKLFDLRKEQELFFSNSFDTIAGYGANGAVVHYRPNEKTNKEIKNGSFLLLDSGGQYFDGTTDVTRTAAIGNISEEMKDNYTLVLKSHIALANASFPNKTPGMKLDAIAREVLLKQGKDYNHGTGHGVGFFLNVHEGPQRISPKESDYPFLENMIVSIEPGYYKENAYGIRIENLYLVKQSLENGMLKFEALTLIPIEVKNINKKMLTKDEIYWINNYNQSVFEKLSPLLGKEENNWLKNHKL